VDDLRTPSTRGSIAGFDGALNQRCMGGHRLDK
jgi:hypothetical protein